MSIINFKRGKKIYPNDFSVKEIYKYYKEHSDNPVSIAMYRKILYAFHEDIINRLIFNSETIRFFSNLGSIRIRKRKKKILLDENGKLNRKNITIDWLKTKELWATKYPNLSNEQILEIPLLERGLVYNSNDHTNRSTFKFFWDTSTVKLPNKTYYTLDMLRIPGNRKLATALKTDLQLQYTYFE